MKNKKIEQLNIINKEKISFYVSIQNMIKLLEKVKKDTTDELKKAKLDYEISFWEDRLNELITMGHRMFDFVCDTMEDKK